MFIHRFDRLPSPKPLHSKGYDTNWKGRQRVSGNIRNSSRGEHNAIRYIYIYIYIHDTNPTKVWARYQRPTDFSFNWVFFERSPLFGGNIGSKTGFLLVVRVWIELFHPQPPPIYKENGGELTFHSWIDGFVLYTRFLLLWSLFAVDPFAAANLFAGKTWKSYRSRWNRGGGGSKRKLEQMFELFALKFYYSTLWLEGGACGLIDSIKFKSDCLNLNWQVNCFELWGWKLFRYFWYWWSNYTGSKR